MPNVRETVTKVLADRGLRPRTLARLAGLGETAIRDILKEMTDDVRLGTLAKIAGVVETPLVAFVGLPAVPAMGIIGKDARIQAPMTQEQELVPAIYSPMTDLVAYHVATESLEPKLSTGDILYVPAAPLGPHERVDPDLLYIVGLDNGDLLVRHVLSQCDGGRLLLALPAGGERQEALATTLRPVLMVCPRGARDILMRGTEKPSTAP